MKKLILAAMAVAVMAVASKAEAALTFSLVLCQTNTCSTFAQNAPNGFIIGGVTIGDYDVSAVIAGGTQSPGGTSSTSLTNTFLVTRNAGTTNSDPLAIWLSVQDFTAPSGQVDFDVTMSTGQTTVDSSSSRGLVTYQAWYSGTNGTFTAAPPAPTLPGGVQASSFASCTPSLGTGTDSCVSNPNSVLVNGTSLFSILSLHQLFINVGDTSQYQTTSSANLSAVPEPGTMVLLGTGLLGMAAMIRRRYARK